MRGFFGQCPGSFSTALVGFTGDRKFNIGTAPSLRGEAGSIPGNEE